MHKPVPSELGGGVDACNMFSRMKGTLNKIIISVWYQIPFCFLFPMMTLCILEAALGKNPGISGDEPVIFLHPSFIPNVSVFLSILRAGRYTFGKPVPGLVNFRVCRKYERAAVSCYGEEARAVCEEFSGQVSHDYSGG